MIAKILLQLVTIACMNEQPDIKLEKCQVFSLEVIRYELLQAEKDIRKRNNI